MNSAVDADGLERLMEAIEKALDDIGQLLVTGGSEPAANSIAARELSVFTDRELVLTAYSQGEILIGVASEHITCFIRACAEPALPIAIWSTVRAALESCALAIWLLDPAIDARTRVGRSFAFRFESLEQQLRMARVTNSPGSIEASLRRISEVEQSALAVGFKKLVAGSGKRKGVGQVMPSITALIRETLDEEAAYRLLSAATHAHPWALLQLGYQMVDASGAPDGLRPMQKAAYPICFQALTRWAIKAFTTAARSEVQLYGRNQELLAERVRDHGQRINELSEAIEFKSSSGSAV